jgi:hypothetical protein
MTRGSTPSSWSFWGPGFWGGGRGWGGAHDGYTTLVLETLVYNLPQDKLVWASQSQTMNLSRVGSFIHELSNKVGTEMQKQGLLGDSARVSAVGFQAMTPGFPLNLGPSSKIARRCACARSDRGVSRSGRSPRARGAGRCRV